MPAHSIRFLCHVAIVFLAFSFSCQSANAQMPQKQDSSLETYGTRVFLDMPATYHDYIRTEIPYINYVRDRALAQVHILLTEETTGSGGAGYTLSFLGNGNFSGINDTLSFFTEPSQSEEIVRVSIVTLLKRGLMRYVEKTPLADRITISYEERGIATSVKDKWDFWVFSLNSQGYVQGEKKWNDIWMSNSLTANRVTPDLKLDISIGTNYTEDNFDISSSTITSITRSQYFSGLAVRSINDHWSYGASADLSASSYDNIDFLASIGPAIEYDVFPYSVSTRRQLRVLYQVSYKHVRYKEETIYSWHQQDLTKQAISATWVAKERWGSVSTSIAGSHFFYDFRKNRLTLTGDLSLNLAKGLSLTATGYAFMIHDLLSTAKGEASYEEILLRQRQIDTQYRYYFYFGLRYSFGSIYTNVVNPRFGS
jgi:hypothetical protein